MENKSIKKIVITPETSGDYFFGLFDENETNKEFNIFLEKNTYAKLFFYIFSSKNSQNYKINIYHDNGANSVCCTYLFATSTAKIILQINSIIDPDKINIKSNQKIEGILFSPQSTILVIPGMSVKSNRSLTMHSVNIGQLDPEKLFYLETRGLTKNISKQTLLSSFFYELSMATSKEVKCLYNKVMEKFKAFVK